MSWINETEVGWWRNKATDSQFRELLGQVSALTAERDSLSAQVTQLRGALEVISRWPRRYTQSESTGTKFYHPSECEIACAALSASPGVSRIENLVRAAKECCSYTSNMDLAKKLGCLRDALAEYERGGGDE